MVAISELHPLVIKTCRPLIVEDEVLRVLVRKFSEAIWKSLSAEHTEKTTIKCNMTHVTDFPDGTEKGSFIGLDFFGKVFRLVYVNLKGDRTFTTTYRLYEYPDNKVVSYFTKFVDYIARCTSNFIDVHDISDEKIILGVASSFSMEQGESFQEAKITDWSKKLQFSDDPSQDFFTQLKISLKKYKNTRYVYLISLVSNSTACLFSGIYKDPAVRIGLYLGDQLNVSYVEKYKNITAFTGDGLRARTALELDLKNFDEDGLLDVIRTEFDQDIDAASPNPGKDLLNKLVTTMYMGEIARLCIYKLASTGVILDGYVSPNLCMKDSIKAADLALLETDSEKKFSRCRIVMCGLGYKNVSDSDCIQIRFVCRCVARRSSNLIAAFLTAMIHKMEYKNIHIIGDGFLLKDFPNYENYLMKKINQLKKQEYEYKIINAEKEEIGAGAGIVAHIYKDSFIKLEDKHRQLPPLSINKLDLKNLPGSYPQCRRGPRRFVSDQ